MQALHKSFAGLWSATRPPSNLDLRQSMWRVMAALEKVAIEDCIDEARRIATAPSAPGDIARLEIQQEACIYLSVALLQGLGRLDEAIFWLRQRKQMVGSIASRFVKNPRIARTARESIFGEFWSAHVGHTAQLGLYVKRKLLEGRRDQAFTLVRASNSRSGNNCLVNHWRRYFSIVDDSRSLPYPGSCLRYLSKDLYLEDRVCGPDAYFWQAWAEISREWERAGGGALLELSGQERKLGQQALAEMGVPPGAWYVCLHVRAAGFKAVHEGLQDALNADIRSYELAIDAIVERGGWVIRMGDPSMPKLPPRKGVVDYAHSRHKADWLDVFLCATCRFYVGTSSGLAYVPNLFGVPCVFTNWFPTGTRPLNGSDLYIPKLHWYAAEDGYAPFAESLAPPLGHIHAATTLRALGVSWRDNTREDLRDVVAEMLERFEAKPAESEDDRQLRARFDAVAELSRSYGNARIGREFIRKHRGLLPSA